jgi:hypothetical protein
LAFFSIRSGVNLLGDKSNAVEKAIEILLYIRNMLALEQRKKVLFI